jgi:hypothetical protein
MMGKAAITSIFFVASIEGKVRRLLPAMIGFADRNTNSNGGFITSFSDSP